MNVKEHERAAMIPVPTYSEKDGRWTFVTGRTGYKSKSAAEDGFGLWLEGVASWQLRHEPRFVAEREQAADARVDEILKHEIFSRIVRVSKPRPFDMTFRWHGYMKGRTAGGLRVKPRPLVTAHE